MVDYTKVASAFDKFAPLYRDGFQQNLFSRMNRQRFWAIMEKNLGKNPARILDFGCGSGEDAQYFAALGHEVVGIDLSPNMIRVAKSNIDTNIQERASFYVATENELTKFCKPKFSFAYSNFGSLNFVNNLGYTCKAINQLLLPNGKFIIAVQNRICIQEFFYYLLHRNLRNATQRWPGQVNQKVIGKYPIEITFYSPLNVMRELRSLFEIQSIYSIGTISLASFWYKKSSRSILNVQKKLNSLEEKAANIPILNTLLAHYSDFFILILKKL